LSLTEECEDELQAEVLEARKALDAAWAKRNELIRLARERGITSNGAVTLTEAQELHDYAQVRFSRALARFSNFVAGQ
jgi:predicted translin family RNA/ssDNA-binding protein